MASGASGASGSSGASGAGGPRARTQLSVEQKAEILTELHRGATRNAIKKQYNIASRTLRRIIHEEKTILKNRAKIKQADGDPSKSKKVRPPEYGLVEAAVHAWYVQKRFLAVPVGGSQLQEVARAFNRRFGGSADFHASPGWLEKFSVRRGIRVPNAEGGPGGPGGTPGPGGPPGPEAAVADRAFESFRQDLGDFDIENIYNANVTGILMKTLPTRTQACRLWEMSAEGRKLTKDRVSLLLCANASGSHKLRALVVGKYRRPRCFRGMDVSAALNVYYTAQKQAWLNNKILTEWLTKEFLPAVRRRQFGDGVEGKVLLLIDHVPSQPPLEVLNAVDPNLEVKFLPHGVATLILDRGAVACTKRAFRRLLLQHLLPLRSVDHVVTAVRELSLLHACAWASSAWASVTTGTLRRVWHCILGVEDAKEALAEERSVAETAMLRHIPGLEAADDRAVRDWLRRDRHEPGVRILADDELADRLLRGGVDGQPDDDEDGLVEPEDDEDPEEQRERHLQAVRAAIEWVRRNTAASAGVALAALVRARDALAKVPL